ncbi:uncharacterized protein ASCRUDRAFT_76065 [Ascoidea rubescens DSM 1968]|uniref:Uncharacterized protein n=1 Tax=Ascoidea rubescens DSM 1968 TaxID=1344418 RepID=A0A1D2VGA3_9ASCO|nr:hypothetical protein ASCRUDRAFT_76065 [Ascoidea rubescens DSM 1968]ODV60688.1 hypothetical protein ASCRUDRAFT_76065 [Ascoidea rubescens DSM 1968]
MANLKYSLSNSGNSASAISRVDLQMGYFGSCLKIHKNSNSHEWVCGNNEIKLLLSDQFFNQHITQNQSLTYFINDTAKLFRSDCITPYILIVAIALSTINLLTLIFISPSYHPGIYRYSAFISYLSFSLALIAAIWQETNLLTAIRLFSKMQNDYYDLSSSYSILSRVFIWVGVALQFITSLLLATLAIVGSIIQIGDFNPDLDDFDEKV